MKGKNQEIKAHEIQMLQSDFMKSYNQNMPASYPRVSIALMNRFREAHATLFKHGDMWSLDQHRKKLMDWLPRNGGIVAGQAESHQ